MLDACSPVLVSGSDPQTGEALTYWMHVHQFWSVVLIQSNTGEALTSWMHVHQSVVLILSNIEEKLTAWMHVHQFWSVVLILSNTGEHSQPGCMFTSSGQWF